jgi:hypothetical protein
VVPGQLVSTIAVMGAAGKKKTLQGLKDSIDLKKTFRISLKERVFVVVDLYLRVISRL